jgi:hypothetical protein
VTRLLESAFDVKANAQAGQDYGPRSAWLGPLRRDGAQMPFALPIRGARGRERAACEATGHRLLGWYKGEEAFLVPRTRRAAATARPLGRVLETA